MCYLSVVAFFRINNQSINPQSEILGSVLAEKLGACNLSRNPRAIDTEFEANLCTGLGEVRFGI